MPEPSNPPTGNTAAPGETACMLSGCHSGGTFTGTVSINGIPDTVFVNQTYDVTIINISNAVRAGFQLTVLDGTNKFTGTLIKGTGVTIAKDNSNGRTYARQAPAKFLSNGTASWSFQWTAPANFTNENLTFYFTSLCANGDGNNSKDNSIKNTKSVILKLLVANSDLKDIKSTVKVFIQNGNLYLQNEQNRITDEVSIINLNGNLVFKTENITFNSIVVPNSIHGIHLVHFKIGQTWHTEKIYIP